MKSSLARFCLALTILFAASLAHADWKKLAPGVEYQEFIEGNMDVHVARIDITNEAIRVIGTRQSEKGLPVSAYAKKNRAIVAINGDYFDEKFRPIGLTIGPCGRWEGTRDTKREGVVAISPGRVEIQRQALIMDPPPAEVEAAVSGWPVIVYGCNALTSKELPGSDAFTRSPHPRTAVGTSRDRTTLYFVVADGRRAGIPGLTLAQLGAFMAEELGVCWAMNLDGGGSTAMWVDDRIINRPSDGVERRVADHLAVVLSEDYRGCDEPSEAPIATSTARSH